MLFFVILLGPALLGAAQPERPWADLGPLASSEHLDDLGTGQVDQKEGKTATNYILILVDADSAADPHCKGKFGDVKFPIHKTIRPFTEEQFGTLCRGPPSTPVDTQQVCNDDFQADIKDLMEWAKNVRKMNTVSVTVCDTKHDKTDLPKITRRIRAPRLKRSARNSRRCGHPRHRRSTDNVYDLDLFPNLQETKSVIGSAPSNSAPHRKTMFNNVRNKLISWPAQDYLDRISDFPVAIPASAPFLRENSHQDAVTERYHLTAHSFTTVKISDLQFEEPSEVQSNFNRDVVDGQPTILRKLQVGDRANDKVPAYELVPNAAVSRIHFNVPKYNFHRYTVRNELVSDESELQFTTATERRSKKLKLTTLELQPKVREQDDYDELDEDLNVISKKNTISTVQTARNVTVTTSEYQEKTTKSFIGSGFNGDKSSTKSEENCTTTNLATTPEEVAETETDSEMKITTATVDLTAMLKPLEDLDPGLTKLVNVNNVDNSSDECDTCDPNILAMSAATTPVLVLSNIEIMPVIPESSHKCDQPELDDLTDPNVQSLETILNGHDAADDQTAVFSRQGPQDVHNQAANKSEEKMLALLARLKQQFYRSFLESMPAREAATTPTLLGMVQNLLAQMEAIHTSTGYFALMAGGSVSDLKDCSTDLIRTLHFIFNACDHDRTVVILTSKCPKDNCQLPFLVAGPNTENFRSVTTLKDIPREIRAHVDDACEDSAAHAGRGQEWNAPLGTGDAIKQTVSRLSDPFPIGEHFGRELAESLVAPSDVWYTDMRVDSDYDALAAEGDGDGEGGGEDGREDHAGERRLVKRDSNGEGLVTPHRYLAPLVAVLTVTSRLKP